MDSRQLIAYALIALIIASLPLFLLARGWARRRAFRAGNKPIHIRN